MTQPHKYDLRDAKTLESLCETARIIRLSFDTPRDCACNREGPCAHHADVWNRLMEAEQLLTRAINTLRHPN